MKLGTNISTNLRGNVADMLEIKGTSVYSVSPRATVYDAIARMTDCSVGALVGIVSERDYTRKVILLGRASKETRVEEIMTPDVITVSPDTTLRTCLSIVGQRGIRHLPVVQDGRVVGVLGVGDLVNAVLDQQAEQIQSLSSFIGSDYPT